MLNQCFLAAHTAPIYPSSSRCIFFQAQASENKTVPHGQDPPGYTVGRFRVGIGETDKEDEYEAFIEEGALRGAEGVAVDGIADSARQAEEVKFGNSYKRRVTARYDRMIYRLWYAAVALRALLLLLTRRFEMVPGQSAPFRSLQFNTRTHLSRRLTRWQEWPMPNGLHLPTPLTFSLLPAYKLPNHLLNLLLLLIDIILQSRQNNVYTSESSSP